MSEADRPKSLRERASAQPRQGGEPDIYGSSDALEALAPMTATELRAGWAARYPNVPKRKRGYYRALKRGDTWAVLRDVQNKMGANFVRKIYAQLIAGWKPREEGKL